MHLRSLECFYDLRHGDFLYNLQNSCHFIIHSIFIHVILFMQHAQEHVIYYRKGSVGNSSRGTFSSYPSQQSAHIFKGSTVQFDITSSSCKYFDESSRYLCFLQVRPLSPRMYCNCQLFIHMFTHITTQLLLIIRRVIKTKILRHVSLGVSKILIFSWNGSQGVCLFIYVRIINSSWIIYTN